MVRLSVHVEGQTEERFVNELLASHLYVQGFSHIWARLYEKPLLGAVAALEIGLETMRAECPHFDCWVSRLESRAA